MSTTTEKTETMPKGWHCLYPPRSEVVHIGRNGDRSYRTLCGRSYDSNRWGCEGIPHFPTAVGRFCPRCYARWIGQERPRQTRIYNLDAVRDCVQTHYAYVVFEGQAREVLGTTCIYQHSGVPLHALRVYWEPEDHVFLHTPERLVLWSPDLEVWWQSSPLAPASAHPNQEVRS